MTATDATVLQDDELLIERIFDAPPNWSSRSGPRPNT